ncbi:ankyrin repeat domain-containing protein, partial [Escherichia coli]
MASRYGHIKTLQWWIDYHTSTNTQPKFTNWAMDYASRNGHIKTLQWW